MKKHILIIIIVISMASFSCSQSGGQLSKIEYNSYKGLVMAGYQGWHDTPDDGAGLGWFAYGGNEGKFEPGCCSIDYWPDTSEYPVLYETPFLYEDGSHAFIQSPQDWSTVETHFRWMEEYGLDGVFMQRFISTIEQPEYKAHFDTVLDHAMRAANIHSRAVCVMYDLTQISETGRQFLLDDIKELSVKYNMFDHKKNPSYLWHNGRPLVTVWGVGFPDRPQRDFEEGMKIVRDLKEMGFSVMIGVPTFWRELGPDTLPDERLHDAILACDIVLPWFVGRYNREQYPEFHELIRKDIEWTEEHGIGYAPLCTPGFSFENSTHWNDQIPRENGAFFKDQLDFCIGAGAEMIYVAMFDEIDEGTAIYKLARRTPVSEYGSEFVQLDEGEQPDHYLVLAGEASRAIKSAQASP